VSIGREIKINRPGSRRNGDWRRREQENEESKKKTIEGKNRKVNPV
jgi:hypothetical protein